MEKSGEHNLNQMSKHNITNNETNLYPVSLDVLQPCNILAEKKQNINRNLIMRQHSDKCKLKAILPNSWSGLF